MGHIHTVALSGQQYKIQPLLYGIQMNSDSAAITTTIDNFDPVAGVQIALKMAAVNDTSATLTINSITATPIYYQGYPIEAGVLKDDFIYNLIYDGTQWHVIGDLTDNDTKVKVIHLEGA